MGKRREREVTFEESYLFADRKTGFWKLTATLVMTEFNTTTLISFASLGFLAGTSALSLSLIFLCGLLFYAFAVAKKWKEIDARSICAFFEKRYGKDFSRVACLFLLLAMLGFSATYIKSLTLIFEPLVSFSSLLLSALLFLTSLFLTLRGGLVAIIRSDVISFLLTLFLIPALLFFVPKSVPKETISLSPSFTLSLILLTMFTYILAPWYGQKMFSARSKKVAFRSVFLSALLIALLYGTVILGGAFASTHLALKNPETALSAMVLHFVPSGWQGLYFALFFLASATTLTGVWNAMSSLFIAEFLQKEAKNHRRAYTVTLFFALFSFLLGNTLIDRVFEKMILANIPAFALSFALLGGFYWKGTTTLGAKMSALIGFFWGIFCYLYFGKENYTWYWSFYGLILIFGSGIFFSTIKIPVALFFEKVSTISAMAAFLKFKK